MLIWIARICLIASAAFTARVLIGVWGHVTGVDALGQGLAVAVDGEPANAWPVLHARFHFFRELFVSGGLMLVAFVIAFAPAAARSAFTWSVMALALAGLTGSYWGGILILSPAVVPSAGAMINHIGNTGFAVLALAFAAAPYVARR
jgi:hypothetical protein